MCQFKYSDIFDDHMNIAKKKFIEKYEREPTFYELIDFYQTLFEHFYY